MVNSFSAVLLSLVTNELDRNFWPFVDAKRLLIINFTRLKEVYVNRNPKIMD